MTPNTLEFKVAYQRQVFIDEIWNGMERAGMKEAHLAKKCGMPRCTIHRFFRADCNPTLETMVRLAHAVGMKLDLRLKN